ncbi:methyltransferase CmcJ [Triangularia verruculosa]|uniref:Methyltransferase CmcJ n=1 Tax=Triangularia verruculosa TaxID=2587418 RepID=A0AAN6X6L0_9PEZI|nr:methyltransferase CmcJ [Triangularia verruculosa]
MPPRDELAKIRYAKDLPLFEREKPYVVLSELAASDSDFRHTNIELEFGKPQVIQDIRGREAEFTLDSNGFQVCHQRSALGAWEKAHDIEVIYLPEVEALLRNELGPDVTGIKIFDWRLRRNVPHKHAGIDRIDLNDKSNYLLPVTTAHIDQTPRGVLSRVEQQMGKQAEALLRGRVRLINIWRPIKHSVQDWPLALCDGSNLEAADLLATDHITKGYVGETYNLLYRDKYRWYYLNQQTPDEVILFKMFDSKRQVKAHACPHASFKHNDIPLNAPPRESIEVRALVFSSP